jgi:hypothetical protein
MRVDVGGVGGAGAGERQMRAPLAVLLLLFAIAANAAEIATENNASCDVGPYPAATLLLPYFEVDINAPTTTAVNTIFTVVNTSRTPQIIRSTIWTDLGYPVAWFDSFLTGYDAQSISMYEVLVRGRFPVTFASSPPGPMSGSNASNPNMAVDKFCMQFSGTQISPALLARLQRELTTGERDDPSCPVGTKHDHAIGYVTVDVINSCAVDSPLDASYWTDVILYDNVLTGEYVRINPDPETGNYAGANPLVHIRAIPEGGSSGATPPVAFPYTFYDRYTPLGARKMDRRQPLPSVFAARWIEGGPTGFQTNLTVWREGITGTTKEQCDYAKNRNLPVPRTMLVRFDEHENATASAVDMSTPSSAAIPTTSSFFPASSAAGDHGGWMWISLDNGNGRAEKSSYSIKRPSQNWIIVQMYAEGRYAVDFDATYLANGCTLTPAITP